MDSHPRRAASMESQGGSRWTLSSRELSVRSGDQVDESVQVDLSADTVSYESDDEMVKRRRRTKKPPAYSREDIREQYCITRREVETLDGHRNKLFGCLHSRNSPCAKESSFLFSCLHRMKRSSSEDSVYTGPQDSWQTDEDITPDDTLKEGRDDTDEDDGGFLEPTWSRRRCRSFLTQEGPSTARLSWGEDEVPGYDVPRAKTSLAAYPSYVGSDLPGGRYSKRPSDLHLSSHDIAGTSFIPSQSVDALNDRKDGSDIFYGGIVRRIAKTPDIAVLDDRRQKHVSFDSTSLIRSNTIGSGLEEVDVGPAATSTPLNLHRRAFSPQEKNRSHERLLDKSISRTSGDSTMSRSLDSGSYVFHTSFPQQTKLRRALMKTQATQTEMTFKAKFLLPAYLTLSPRATSHYGKHRHKRLTKSHSAHMVLGSESDEDDVMEIDLSQPKHHRIVHQRKLVRQHSADSQKEIMVSFKPAVSSPPRVRKEVLIGAHAKLRRVCAAPCEYRFARIDPEYRDRFQSTKPEIPKKPPPRERIPIRRHSSVSLVGTPIEHPILVRTSTDENSEISGERSASGRLIRFHSDLGIRESSSFKSSSESNNIGISDEPSPTGPQDRRVRIGEEVRVDRLTSPDEESSSSHFTERDTSRSELSTSSSNHMVKSEQEEITESSEYITATERSHFDASKLTAILKPNDYAEESHTSFDTASSASIFSSPSSLSSFQTRSSKIEESKDKKGAAARSSGRLDRGDSSDESTEKEGDDDSESDWIAPSREAEERYGIGSTGDSTPIPGPSPEPSSLQDVQTVIEIKSEATSEELVESISFESKGLEKTESESTEDSSSALSGPPEVEETARLPLSTDIVKVPPDELSTVSEVSEESSQEELTPWPSKKLLEPEESLRPAGSAEQIGSEATTPSVDSTTSGSFVLDSSDLGAAESKEELSTDLSHQEETTKQASGYEIPPAGEDSSKMETASEEQAESLREEGTSGIETPPVKESKPKEEGVRPKVCRQCGEKIRKERRRPKLTRWPEIEPEVFGEEDEDAGIHLEPYQAAQWVLIREQEEMETWKQMSDQTAAEVEDTQSEREFLRHYRSVTHRLIHRRSSVAMYNRLASSTFDVDYRVRILRDNGEFGFRIHGSKPVVVSAIEDGTPAESCGLKVGDIIISINGVNILDASHSEVVHLAHTGTETLQLEVARSDPPEPPSPEPLPTHAGFLQRLSVGGAEGQRWCRRWFVLRQDNCLYWYRDPESRQLLGVIVLQTATVARVTDPSSPHAFKLTKLGVCPLFFAADDEEMAEQWISALTKVAATASQLDVFLESSVRALHTPALAFPRPDCAGHLAKLSTRLKAWRRRFFVLKNASLYFYIDRNATAALGMFQLHGYRVQSCTGSGKRNTFEAVPPEPRLRHFYFLADTDTDKKRWLAALEYSIDRWFQVS